MQLKKIVLSCCLIILLFPTSVWAAEPVITAKAGLVMDAATGQILWQHNADEQLPPASTTKILTALLALDLGDLQQTCVVSAKAAQVGESSIHLRVDEQLSLLELLQGALIPSGNDACFAIAENIAGSEQFFVYLMNLKAALVGANRVQVANTNGLPNAEHLMTAYDLAVLSRYAMNNPTFKKIVTTTATHISGGRFLKNTNKLLSMNSDVCGIKTGTTNDAGACLVSAMQKDDRLLIAVVLNSSNRYGDSLQLLNYGMDNFVKVDICSQGEVLGLLPVSEKLGFSGPLHLVAGQDSSVLCPKDEINKITALWTIPKQIDHGVVSGQLLGQVQFRDQQGHSLAVVSVLSGEEIKVHSFKGLRRILEKI